jgi:type IV pilus assembly protein PilV
MVSVRSVQGVGMVEILVTLFVLTIGLLGVASLQFVGSFTNAEAMSRTQAEFVAQQVSERLHAAALMDTMAQGMLLDDGYFQAANYNFSSLTCASSADDYDCFCTSRPAEIPDCEGGECSQTQMATYDAWVLSCSAIQANPQTELSVTCSDNDSVVDALACSPGSFIQIQLRWPLRTQRNTEIQTDARCQQATGQAYACVTKVMAL